MSLGAAFGWGALAATLGFAVAWALSLTSTSAAPRGTTGRRG